MNHIYNHTYRQLDLWLMIPTLLRVLILYFESMRKYPSKIVTSNISWVIQEIQKLRRKQICFIVNAEVEQADIIDTRIEVCAYG